MDYLSLLSTFMSGMLTIMLGSEQEKIKECNSTAIKNLLNLCLAVAIIIGILSVVLLEKMHKMVILSYGVFLTVLGAIVLYISRTSACDKIIKATAETIITSGVILIAGAVVLKRKEETLSF